MPPKKSGLSQLKSAVNQYNNCVSKCQVVLNGTKYDKYESTLNKLEDKYDLLTQAWETFKEEILDKGKTVQEFNAKKPEPNEDEFVYTHNDSWKEDKERSFLDLFERLSDDKPPIPEVKVDTGETAQLQVLCQEMKTLIELIGSTTLKLTENISKTADTSADETIVERYVQLIHTQRERLTGVLSEKLKLRMKMTDVGVDHCYSKEEFSSQVSTFCSAQLEKLDHMELTLVHKVKPRSFSTPGTRSSPSSSSTDKVLLAKTKPPIFKGEILDYPQF